MTWLSRWTVASFQRTGSNRRGGSGFSTACSSSRMRFSRLSRYGTRPSSAKLVRVDAWLDEARWQVEDYLFL